MLITFLHPTEHELQCCSVPPVLPVGVCCECGLFMQLFDLQSPDLYSCEGDLDAQTSTDFHLSLRGTVLSFLAMCEKNAHCDLPLLYVCTQKHHHASIPVDKHTKSLFSL